MITQAAQSHLQEIPVDRIDLNPDNPRILFRQSELDDLLESIRLYGVQVPISVFKDKSRYVLIDGERRWRCARKLNKSTIPAVVQEKPDALTNLLLMFNIHSLREQWDLLTIAMKLPKVIGLLARDAGKEPNENELSTATGLSRGVIRRCKLLIELPERYRQDILTELHKPKPQQRITEDFFIEMERALKTVERALPDVIPDKDTVRQVLLQKYKNNIIPNIIHFRNIGRIARAENVGCDTDSAKVALTKLFTPNRYSIEDAYESSVSEAYSERDVVTRINSLVDRLTAFEAEEVDDELRASLRRLVDKASRLLEGDE